MPTGAMRPTVSPLGAPGRTGLTRPTGLPGLTSLPTVGPDQVLGEVSRLGRLGEIDPRAGGVVRRQRPRDAGRFRGRPPVTGEHAAGTRRRRFDLSRRDSTRAQNPRGTAGAVDDGGLQPHLAAAAVEDHIQTRDEAVSQLLEHMVRPR